MIVDSSSMMKYAWTRMMKEEERGAGSVDKYEYIPGGRGGDTLATAESLHIMNDNSVSISVTSAIVYGVSGGFFLMLIIFLVMMSCDYDCNR